MAQNNIQVNYEALEGIMRQFGQNADDSEKMRQRLRAAVETLVRGGWQGAGADSFFKEMDGEIFPAMERLVRALEAAQQVTGQIAGIFDEAEQEGAGLFKRDEGGADPSLGTAAGAAASAAVGESVGQAPGASAGSPTEGGSSGFSAGGSGGGGGGGGGAGWDGSGGGGGGGGGQGIKAGRLWGEGGAGEYEQFRQAAGKLNDSVGFAHDALKLGGMSAPGVLRAANKLGPVFDVVLDEDFTTDPARAVSGEVGKQAAKMGISALLVGMIPVVTAGAVTGGAVALAVGGVFLASEGVQLAAYVGSNAAKTAGNSQLAERIDGIAKGLDLGGYLERGAESMHDWAKPGVAQGASWIGSQVKDFMSGFRPAQPSMQPI